MRHRIGISDCTGLGNPEKCLLNNVWSKNLNLNDQLKIMFEEAIPLFLKKIGGCDFTIHCENDEITIIFGYEPAYKFEDLIILQISTDKNKCYKDTGISFECYGSGIRHTKKYYSKYKKKCKFVNFADKWSNILRGYTIG